MRFNSESATVVTSSGRTADRFFSGGGLASETKFSWSVGAGAKYYPRKSIGLRAHVRYKPVILHDRAAGDFCDPFGFCQSWLSQFEVLGGVVARF